LDKLFAIQIKIPFLNLNVIEMWNLLHVVFSHFIFYRNSRWSCAKFTSLGSFPWASILIFILWHVANIPLLCPRVSTLFYLLRCEHGSSLILMSTHT